MQAFTRPVTGPAAARARGALGAAAAALLLSACTTQQVMNVALARDPKAALKQIGNAKVETYKRDPKALLSDFDRLGQELNRLFASVKQESEKNWGSEGADGLPGAKRYVKYTEAYRNRIIVDYETATVRVEHLQEAQAVAKLRNAIVVALLTPQDPKSADVFSDEDVQLDGTPFLQSLVLDQNRKPLATREDVERFADYLAANRVQTRRITAGGAPAEVAYIQFDMIGADQIRAAAEKARKKPAPAKPPRKGAPGATPDFKPDQRAGERADPNNYAAADRIAPKFRPLVEKYAQKTGVDPALIFGIIYQESRFNPHAVSTAEAYGMMQLVPKSGGLEAFRKAKGEAVRPTKEYLMDPENNIELGATYLNILLFDYWMKGVENFPAREYCAISGYNTGPGNLARAFTNTTSKLAEAQARANGMAPDELFDFLRVNLPYAETRDYLLRVAAARRHYKDLFYPDR